MRDCVCGLIVVFVEGSDYALVAGKVAGKAREGGREGGIGSG